MTQTTITPEALRARMAQIASARIGMDGYADMLGSLRAGPMSTLQLAAKHGVHRTAVQLAMRHCVRAKVVHRTGWFRTQPHARLVPMWALGGEGDISMPQFEERPKAPRRAPSTLILLTTVVEMLKDRPYTRAELAEELRMHVESAVRVLTALRRNRLCFVESWDQPPVGTTVAEFRYGVNRADKPRPPPRANGEQWAVYRGRRSQMRVMQALAGKAGQGVVA